MLQVLEGKLHNNNKKKSKTIYLGELGKKLFRAKANTVRSK